MSNECRDCVAYKDRLEESNKRLRELIEENQRLRRDLNEQMFNEDPKDVDNKSRMLQQDKDYLVQMVQSLRGQVKQLKRNIANLGIGNGGHSGERFLKKTAGVTNE